MAEDTGSKSPSYNKLRGWIERDMDRRREWLDEARIDYDFYSGHQWDDADVKKMQDERRPVITFEIVGPMIRAVGGLQSQNRQEVRFQPRGVEDSLHAEMWTEASRWFEDQNDGQDAEDEAFMDACICGLGFVEVRLDYDLHPDGEPMEERVNPYEMGWDHTASKKNLSDARRVWRARDLSLGEAKALFPDFESQPEKLDARWARDRIDRVEDVGNRYDLDDGAGADGDLSDDDTVTLIQIQWWQTEERVRMPDGRELMPDEASEEIAASLASQAMQAAGLDGEAPDTEAMAQQVSDAVQELTIRKRVYKQAWLGSEILELTDAPFQTGGFSWKPMTGFRDQNKGYWYGIVRAMRDPQRMANKWLSQTVHILNTTAKGGVAVERGAVEDPKQFEKSWAKAEAVTYLEDGGMNKIMPKPSGSFPSGFHEMTLFAAQSARTASGINQEIQGMREASQPGIVEDMRRQQSMTQLSALFKALTQHRKQKGRLRLELMKNWVPEQRLSRILGERYRPEDISAAYQASEDYDVVVDEMATNPNQKTMVWNMISGIFNSIPLRAQAELWMYSPLPETAAAKIRDAYLAELEPDPAQVKLDQQAQKAEILKNIGTARKSGGQ